MILFMYLFNISIFSPPDIEQPNVFTEEEARVSQTIIISVAVSVTLVCLIIGIVVPVLAVIVCCTKIRRTKHEQDNKLQRKLLDLREEHSDELRKLKEKNKTDIEKLEAQNTQKNKKLALDMFEKSVEKGKRAKLIINETDGSLQIFIDSEASSNGIQRLESNHTEQTDGPDHPRDLAIPDKGEVRRKLVTPLGKVKNTDETDGPVHSHYVARARNEYTQVTVEPVIKDGTDGRDTEIDKRLALHCMKCVIEMSLTHPVYGEELKTYMSEVGRQGKGLETP